MTTTPTKPRIRARGRAAARPTATKAAAERATFASALPGSLLLDLWRYQLDFWQRSMLFVDTLRERGDNMLAHEEAGLPPLLSFAHETIMDARKFERPANYALLRIRNEDATAAQRARKNNRPVIVFDPRAGHSPGIGGVSSAIPRSGSPWTKVTPVYFVIFCPDPCPGQDLAVTGHVLRTMFGIYVAPDSDQQVRKDIALLAVPVWNACKDDMKYKPQGRSSSTPCSMICSTSTTAGTTFTMRGRWRTPLPRISAPPRTFCPISRQRW